MHYVLCKPKIWNKKSLFIGKYTRGGEIMKKNCKKYHDIWTEYAKNTSVFSEIIKLYKLQ